MTVTTVGSVDVYPMRGAPGAWEMLLLQRAPHTRCTGAWEVVHGHIQHDETPPHAAVRELREETGLGIARLYNVTVQPFYLHTIDTVMLAVVFAAMVNGDSDVVLGPEHERAAWLSVQEAMARVAWPRSRAVMQDILALVGSGSAGPVEDVLRVL
ncbi:MAG TPA: NUDIX domain-containing protein [Gemmatimonadaceae bacterium]|nr:NUDIX domain-containing protein [Gemmatimonadaceae bacterium]